MNNIDKYLPNVDSAWYRDRLSRMMLLILGAFALLLGRLFYLQIIAGDAYYHLSKNNCIRIQRVKPSRGLIFDRNGTLLVENRPSFDLAVIPCDAKPLSRTLDKLSTLLPEFEEDIRGKTRDSRFGYGYRPVLLKNDIGRDALGVVSAHRFELPGIVIETNAVRHYLYGDYAAHLIGYLGEINAKELESGAFPHRESGDFIGRCGIEKVFETNLAGIPGGRIVQVNANGQMMEVLDTVDPEPGQNVFLTLDDGLQSTAQRLMADRAGAVVALDPFSGELLAVCSSPAFDPNSFVSGISSEEWQSLVSNPDRPMMNKAWQGEYPPASTYKVVTAIAGLEEGVVDENTTFYCPGGLEYGNRFYGCWKEQGHGALNIVEALAQSCDVYFYQIGRKLGVDRLAWYAGHCGLGAATGIGVDRESPGLIPTAAWKKKRTGISWQGGENLSIAIGQGYNLTTPLQVAVLYAAVANGGTLFRPRILKSIESVEGKIVKTPNREILGRLPVSRHHLDLVRKGLREVVHGRHGTARSYVYDKTVDISGKTGTAQVVSRKTEKEGKKPKNGSSYDSHAWFVGYAPSDDPKIAVCVLVEHGEHGSSGAGPIAKEMIVSYLQGMVDRSPAAFEQ